MNADKGLAWRPLEGVCTVNVGPFLFSLLEIPLMLRQVAEKVDCDNNRFGHGSVGLVQILKTGGLTGGLPRIRNCKALIFQ